MVVEKDDVNSVAYTETLNNSKKSRSNDPIDGNGRTESDNHDGSSSDLDDVYDNDSQASLIYNSEDNDTSSADTEDEKDYFGESSISLEPSESEVAWVDSDENEDLREDYPNSATWLLTEGLTKTIQKSTKKISFKLNRKVFTTKCKIKLFKSISINSTNNVISSLRIAVDTFNLIYLITDFDNFKVYKIDYFKISSFVHFNGRLLFSSNSSSFIKELSLDGKVTDINKRTGHIKKMCVDSELYVIGDKLYRFDKNLNLKDVFNSEFIDICVNKNNVVCLKENGDIYVFDKSLCFRKKYSLPGKFQFRNIFGTQKNYFIAVESGFYVLDLHFELVKEFSNAKGLPTDLVFNNDFVVYSTNYQNGLRIVKDGLISYDRFPFSKVKIDPISCLDFQNDVLYFCHSKFVSMLRLTYSNQ